MKKIGLALGGGGAKGLAHIPLLGVFEEMGVRPYRVAGTSIGAVIGAMWAGGMKAAEIRQLVGQMIVSKGETLRSAWQKKELWQWAGFLDVDWRGRGLVKGDRLGEFLQGVIQKKSFEELEIPLKVVASNFWSSQQVVLESGPLLSAVRASMGLPGVFTPVQRDGLTLIDGGGVNPVPHDILDDCEAVVAIDVMGRPAAKDTGQMPSGLRALLETFDIMQRTIIAEKIKRTPPEVYIVPEIAGIDILDFHRAEEVYRQAEGACGQLREALGRLMNG